MKNSTLLCFFILISISFYSCNQRIVDKKEVLSVSIDPQKYFLKSIVGDNFNINSVISSGSNPESFDPTPLQMITLGESKIYFKVGQLGFENVWINDVKKNNPDLSIIDCSQNIPKIQGCEHHEHEHNHDHTGSDPHIWSSPNTAAVMAKNMYNAIIEFDTDNKEFYSHNLNKLLNEFSQTDSIIKRYIEDAPSKSFLIYHPALSYFAEEYGLTQYSIEYEGKNPSPTQLRNLIDLAKENNIKVVFVQKEFDQKNAETIAKEIGARIVPIDLLSYNWSDELIKIAKAFSSDNE